MIFFKILFFYIAFLCFILEIIGAPIVAPKTSKIYDKNEMKAIRAMINKQMLEGDIFIANNDKKSRKFNPKNGFRNAVHSDEFIWTNGIIPYVLDDTIVDQKELIMKAMQQIEKHTCIRFREKFNEDNEFIRIYKGKGCFASVGRNPDIPQGILSLGDGCHYIGTVIHELMHVIGYYHEHNRQDRDNYLKIYFNNIRSSDLEEFMINDPLSERILTAFDYNSVMLYGPRAFSINDESITMEPKLPGFYMIEVFEKPGITKLDAESIKKLYKCPTN